VGQIGLLDQQRRKKTGFPHFSVEILQTTETFRSKEKKDLFKIELPEKDEALGLLKFLFYFEILYTV
jgi:hypothetical protein